MPYVYRRKPELIDFLIDHFFVKEVVIRDGTSEGGDYVLVINGYEFREADPTPGADSSSTIASNFETDINNSILKITASATGNVLTLTPDVSGKDFSLETETSDENGDLYYRDRKPESYQVKNAANWDGTFTVMETVPQRGLVSSSVRPESVDFPLNNQTRFRFSPFDYTLEDDDVHFFRIAPVTGGVAGTDGPIIITLTPEQLSENHPGLILQGNAPIAADSDSALEFTFPYQTTSIEVRNLEAGGGETVYLSFGTGDGEIPLAPGESFKDNKFGSGDLRIRTDAGAATDAAVSIYASMNNSRILS